MMEGVRGSGRGYQPRTNRYPLSEKAPNTHIHGQHIQRNMKVYIQYIPVYIHTE